MQPPQTPHDIPAATEQLLQSIPAAACLVSLDDHRIVLYNQAARDLIGNALSAPHLTCHALLCQNDSPCDNCQARQDDADSIPELRSATVHDSNHNTCFIKYQCAPWQGYTLVLFFNISREIKLLHATDLARKEQQAKLVMQDHRQQEVLATISHLELMIDHIPEAVLSVDESFFIIKKNKAADALPTSTGAQRCFDLVGRSAPCENCPARDGFHSVTEHVKSHTIDGIFLTETISKSPKNDGGLLLFRDTTRQIKLVAQIKEQQDSITRQNEILSGLANFGTYIQQETKLSDVVEFFLNLFLPIIETDTGVIIVNDTRPGNILCHVEQGISEEELAILMRAYLSRDMQTNRIESIPEDALPWPDSRQIPLLGTDGGKVGILILRNVDREHDDNINLFAEPLGACVHNRLLTLKLEEKANTDPLTGIYNRGYFHRALEMEQEKFKTLGINHAVVEADINRLKFANDQYGHDAGDLLIITASKILGQSVRMGDVVARTGGDEFLILLTNTGSEGAAAFIQRLRKTLAQDSMISFANDVQFPLEISLGYAGTDEFSPEEIIKNADNRMYAEKEAYYQQHPDRRRQQTTE
ncbi:MAG: GGDEF domain-containing protein [Desulfobulbaceae bacterium]|nr:GGDEF domain-containing protein [Desulfobulbaceae bacterium]